MPVRLTHNHAVKIRLAENFRAVFYAPLYVLKALDFSTPEGVIVEWLPARAPGVVFDEVKRGVVDLTWGGPMRVIKDHDATPLHDGSLHCFGEIISRDPFYLVARPEWRICSLRNLPRARLTTVSEVPTPWLCLQADLREAGISRMALRHAVTGLSMHQQLQALREGKADVVQLCEPFVSEAVAEGIGHVVYAACCRGPTVYTTFICSTAGIAEHQDAFERLTTALGRVLSWIKAHDSDEIACVIAPFFPEIPTPLLCEAVRRYSDAGIWAHQPKMSRAGFDRLAHSLHSTGYISSPQSYESCVASFAQ